MPANTGGKPELFKKACTWALLSSLVDAVGQHDAVLLDELEAKIRRKRQELSRAAK